MKTLAFCGHEIDVADESKNAVYVRDVTRSGKRAVSFRTVCPQCKMNYDAEHLILRNEQEQQAWLTGNKMFVGA